VTSTGAWLRKDLVPACECGEREQVLQTQSLLQLCFQGGESEYKPASDALTCEGRWHARIQTALTRVSVSATGHDTCTQQTIAPTGGHNSPGTVQS